MNRDLAATLGCLLLLVGAAGVTAQQLAEVSQRNRAFTPSAITVGRGESVVFINDDAELLHHVHGVTAGAIFDIGEQPAGTRVPVRFANAGTFEVRCGIHPRMRLLVTVR